jgi:hypothetical protein
VVALVTSTEPVAERDVLDYPGLRLVLTCSTGPRESGCWRWPSC